MHPTAKNELKIAIKVYYNRYKHKGKAHTFGVFKNQGLSKTSIFEWLAKVKSQGDPPLHFVVGPDNYY